MRDLKRVTVDTTVQPKAITFPTDAKLVHAAIKGLNRLAREHGLKLRQSYLRIAKQAAMMAGRYAHAKQFKRHRRQLSLLRTRLGRLIRDIRRKIAGQGEVEAALEQPLWRAAQIRAQEQRQRGWKLYSFHAPEVECIGKGKASAPYEFGVKASVVTTNARAPGGQFVCTPRHCRATPMTATPSATSSTPPRSSPVALSSGPMSTRAIAVTTHQIRAASSYPARSAASSERSNASSDAAPPSSP
jgi:IS5 family transposase